MRDKELKTLREMKVHDRVRDGEDDSGRQSGKYERGELKRGGRWSKSNAGKWRRWMRGLERGDPDRCVLSPQVAEGLFDKEEEVTHTQ